MNEHDITSVFAALTDLRIGVIGDFAIDFYYQLEKETGETSIETGKTVYRGTHTKTYLGAAGNVVQNLSTLGVGTIYTFGVLSDDIFGRELLHLLHQLEVNTDHMVTKEADWDSYAYIKPIEEQGEEHRVDFGSYNQLDEASRTLVLDLLEDMISQLDVVIMNQQFVSPLLNESSVSRLNEMAKKYPHCRFFADLRNLGSLIRGITLKANTEETARILGLSSSKAANEAWCREQAVRLSEKIQAPVLMTRGENGILYYDGQQEIFLRKGIFVQGEVDPVGAGDTAISTFAACIGVGTPAPLALETANLAAAVTIKKLQQTGTASPDEILQLRQDHSLIYHADIAAHPDKAVYIPQTSIEIVEPYPGQVQVQYVVFDHDGTISTLRMGWEDIMIEVMMENIAGDQQLSPAQRNAIMEKVSKLIEQTTGLPTLVQMQGLVQLVQEEGFVKSDQIQTAEAYKAQYLEKLEQYVQERVVRYQQEERDFTISGIRELLEALYQKKVKLYLASGTDEPSVIQEASVLGYTDYFSGGIHGAKLDQAGAKRRAITEILAHHYCEGKNIAVIGDGPAEIREGRRVGALCIGVASNEAGGGLSKSKRTVLIRAGAHIIIPDFTEREQLLALMFGKTPMEVS